MSEAPPVPKRRIHWGRWLLVLILISPFLMVLVHAYWTYRARQRLEALVATYKVAGEPTLPEDLEREPTGSGPNAVTDLIAAATAIKRTSAAWQTWDRLDRAMPLTEKEKAAAKAVVGENADAYAAVDSAFEKKRVDWHVRVRSPTMSILLPDLNEQRMVTNALIAA